MYKIREVRNVEFLYIQKSIYRLPHITRLSFVCILYSLHSVHMYKKIQRQFQLASCIGFIKFVNYFYSTEKHTFQVSAFFSLLFVQILCSLYIFCIHKGISNKCIIIQNSLSYKILICETLYTKYTQIYCFA